MADQPIGILFLCTGNSARSVIAERLMAELGGKEFLAYSAGSQPTGKPNPFAIEVLASNGIDISGVRSKSWDDFTGANAPAIDIVITVCDSAASETCPVWPGHPMTAHWGVADPAAIEGDDEKKRMAFATTYSQMLARISALLRLDYTNRDEEFRQALRDIGKMETADV